MKFVVNHPKIGTIEVRSRKGNRQISYKIYADKVSITSPVLAIPTLFPLPQDKENWIIETQTQLQSKMRDYCLTAAGLHTSHIDIDIQVSNYIKTTFATETSPQKMIIFHQPHIVLSETKNQKILWNIITPFLKKEAAILLPQRLDELAKIHHFTYQKVSINSAKSRWGSCSATGKINLSCYLLLLPDRLIDFVLIHELCHTREMNHGKEFKRLMRSIFPDYDCLNKELKNTTIKPI